MFNLPSLHSIALMLPAIILGLTFHEFAHGWVADRLGDPTARHHGRLTVNPLAHVDPIGFILLFLAGFGWAKPVPVNPYNLKGDIRQGMLLISLAGPATNLLLAFLSALLLGAFGNLGQPYFVQIMYYMILINVVLAVFNLLPIPPLDGSKILAGILPGEQKWLGYLENYGIIILIILIFTGAIQVLFRFVVSPIANFFFGLAGY